MLRSFRFLTFVCASLAWSAAARAADPIAPACGDTIGPGGSYTLTADVGPCGVSTVPALTIVGPVTVDLAGHAVVCDEDDGLPPGVVVLGTAVVLANGTVRGCAGAVELLGEGGHRVERLTIDGYGASAGFGIAARGDGNTIVRNRLRTCPELNEFDTWAVIVEGDGNVVRRNVVRQNGCGYGFHVRGNDNVLVGNNQGRVHDYAYTLLGDRNTLRRNALGYSHFFGVYVDGAENDVVRNVVRRSNNRPSYTIYGARNHARGNTALESGWTAFEVDGEEMIVEGNVAANSEYAGFTLLGTGMQIVGNVAIENTSGGFTIGGSGHAVTSNTAIRNGDGPNSAGIWVGGTGHQVTDNQALENRGDGIRVSGSSVLLNENLGYANEGFDLADEATGCGTNVWTFNEYETRNQSCVQ
jgi:hypothetical protein